MVKNIIYGLCGVLIGAIVGYCWAIRSNGTGIDEVRNELNTAQDTQQRIADAVDKSQDLNRNAGAIIEECQRITAAIRKRPAK